MSKPRLLLLAVVVVAGCVSTPPPRYYTLNMEPSGQVSCPCNVDVERLRPHEPLARKEILVKASPTKVEYYASDQWAADLGELVQEKLQSEFGPGVEGRRTVVISGLIRAFEQEDVDGSAEAHIKLDLQFRPGDAGRYEPPFAEKQYETRVHAEAPTATGVVEALSKGLEEIAQQIAKDMAEIK